MNFYDPHRYQPIGSWQAIDEYWDEIDGPDMDATESDHNLEASPERGYVEVSP